jgi:type II secretory ATPase GspE/PulE/Tfp pilus assembly ATPase PilB-like protein
MHRSVPELGHILIRNGLITSRDLAVALDEQKQTRERLGEILCRQGLITEEDLLDALAHQFGHRRYDPARDAVEPAALDLLPLEFARRHNLLPIRVDDGKLWVAVNDPMDVEARDALQRVAARSGREVGILLAPRDILSRAREAQYGRVEGNRSVNELIDKVVDEIAEIGAGEISGDEADPERSAQDAGVINLVDRIVAQALQERATDIHIEPQERGLVIRYRVDGLLYDALTPPRAVYTGVISRVKILADMDIAERRAAQDGRFSLRRGGQEVDIRVSAVPTIHGEKLVLRLLDKTNFNFSLRDLGFDEGDYETFRRAIRQPYGMVLLSGPTGSGKSTTLYAGLLEIRNETLNVMTVEDPVEYQIPRISQVAVNERKGVTFAQALRSFLRQDPDVIMVGEIRDRETAEIAVRAALTGHMVFSTIHANDAPATAVRLLSMDVEPFMAASALTLVAAQRLVRRNCKLCLEEYEPAAEVRLALGLDAGGIAPGAKFQRGRGCAACKGRGYQGRVAILELMKVSPELRQRVAQNRPANELREQAAREGMRSLRQSGIEKAMSGMTTVEEVLRVCLSDE